MTTHDLVAPTSDGDDHGAGDEGAEVPPADRLDAGRVSGSATNSPSPAPPTLEPFTEAEFDAIIGTIWNGLEGDPTRFDDLLADALGFVAAVALRPDLTDTSGRAAGLLRRMEQRALWGPNLEHEDHR
jgi:hypothetical protein